MHKARRGYVALLSVLIVAAIAASTVLILFVTSLNSSLNSANIANGKIARALADSCAEQALQSLTDCSPLCKTGSPALCNTGPNCPLTITSFSTGDCDVIDMSNASGNIWTIQAIGTMSGAAGFVKRYVEVKALKPSTGSAAVVSSWKECPSFPCP